MKKNARRLSILASLIIVCILLLIRNKPEEHLAVYSPSQIAHNLEQTAKVETNSASATVSTDLRTTRKAGSTDPHPSSAINRRIDAYIRSRQDLLGISGAITGSEFVVARETALRDQAALAEVHRRGLAGMLE